MHVVFVHICGDVCRLGAYMWGDAVADPGNWVGG